MFIMDQAMFPEGGLKDLIIESCLLGNFTYFEYTVFYKKPVYKKLCIRPFKI